ncbi:hypothetical protein GCM10012283_04560 [Phycicoccus endophyticus]|nr:hypothetical protein GCM10012283_04560 [Phycicoccus endophyticus]
MRWRVRLYCGHVVETTASAERLNYIEGPSDAMACPDCGLDPAAVVATKPLGVTAP